MPPTSTTEEEILPEEDRLLFGPSTFKIVDDLNDSIDQALIDGVKSLPPTNNSSLLLEKLRKSHSRNLMVLETYLARNIFSIQSLQPTRRKKVLHAFLSEEMPKIPNKVTPDLAKPEIFQYPSKDDVPSEEDLNDANAKITDLRSKLRIAKRRRNEVQLKLELIVQSKQKAQTVKTVSSAPGELHSTVASIVDQAGELERLKNQANGVSKRLGDKKNARPDDDEEVTGGPKKPKLSLEETYENHTKVMKTTGEGLTKISGVLKERNSKE